MTLKYKDTFQGTAGSSLAAHTSDSQATYADRAGDFTLDSAGNIAANGQALVASSASTDGLVYPATFTFPIKVASVANGAVGIVVYQAANSSAGLWLRHYDDGSNNDAIQMLQLDASGGNTLLGLLAYPRWAAGSTNTVQLVINASGDYTVNSGPAGGSLAHAFDAKCSSPYNGAPAVAPLTGGTIAFKADFASTPTTGSLIGAVSLTDSSVASAPSSTPSATTTATFPPVPTNLGYFTAMRFIDGFAAVQYQLVHEDGTASAPTNVGMFNSGTYNGQPCVGVVLANPARTTGLRWLDAAGNAVHAYFPLGVVQATAPHGG